MGVISISVWVSSITMISKVVVLKDVVKWEHAQVKTEVDFKFSLPDEATAHDTGV